MQSDFYFIAIFFVRFALSGVCVGARDLISGILFYFNRFELCENVEEWLIFHDRNAVHDIRSIPYKCVTHSTMMVLLLLHSAMANTFSLFFGNRFPI